MKVLITSGGCKVPIDDVRHIGNFSSGRYGAELADAFTTAGHEVTFFCEKGSQEPKYHHPKYSDDKKVLLGTNPRIFKYKDYTEYLSVKEIIKREQPDVIVSAAAISDYVLDKTDGKISSDGATLTLTLRRGEKVIETFRELAPNALIVGFKLLVSPTKEEKYKAIESQLNYVDHVIYNDLTELRKGNAKREFVHWATDGRICTSNLDVEDIVQEIVEILPYKIN